MPNFYSRPTRSEDIDHALISNVLPPQHHTKTVSGEIDHGSIQGLEDHDHLQYLYEGNYDYSFQNIIRNGDFEEWSKGTTEPPDGWLLTGTGSTITRVTDKKRGKYGAKVTNGAELDAYLYQWVSSDLVSYYRGRKVTFGCWVKTSVASVARILITDSGGSTWSSYHSGSGNWELLTLSRTVDAAANTLRFQGCVSGVTSQIAYFDGAVAVEGKFLPAFIPHSKDRSVGLGYENPEAFANNAIQKTDTQRLLDLADQGSIDWTDLDINTAGTGLVPIKANAVMVLVRFRDSGTPATAVNACLRKKGETAESQQVKVWPLEVDIPITVAMTIGLDSDGIIQYSINASGESTADLNIRLFGWIEPA